MEAADKSINASRGLGDQPSDASSYGSFSPSRNRAILITGLTCATFSLVSALLALRWFLLMRRSFRHHLILFLITSATFRSIWYFIFPIVVFIRGPVNNSSAFCQASGFFLAVGLEVSDFAILVIALHTILHIFRPTKHIGKGGLYPYRHYVYVIWIGLPLLAGALAFINPESPYVTAGTFCYLPKRPFWYRLALAWIPRYIIFITIFAMYVTIYVYVHVKFRAFSSMGNDNYGSFSEDKLQPPKQGMLDGEKARLPQKAGEENTGLTPRPRFLRSFSQQTTSSLSCRPETRAPWDDLTFITSTPLCGNIHASQRIAAADYAQEPGPSTEQRHEMKGQTNHANGGPSADKSGQEDRKVSEVPTIETTMTETSHSSVSGPMQTSGRTNDPLVLARLAIRRQLRFLFVYPAVYVAMWSFPFASHCLLYNDYYVAHSPFWLTIISTGTLASMAGVDCIVFCWKERPWNKVDPQSPFSLSSMLRLCKLPLRAQTSSGRGHEAGPAVNVNPDVQHASKKASNWWEAEARWRQGSLWSRTTPLTQVASQQTNNETDNETISRS